MININQDKVNAVLEAKAIQDAKEAKDLTLNSITVTTTNGNVFDGRPQDINLMVGAILASETLVSMVNAQYNAIPTPTADETAQYNLDMISALQSNWRLHDNTESLITLAELKEALALAMQSIGQIKLSGGA